MTCSLIAGNEMDVKTSLSLSEATFITLLSLAPQPSHGYAIMKEVAALSGDRAQLSTGTLYGALKRLMGRGWVARFDETIINGRERKAYRHGAAYPGRGNGPASDSHSHGPAANVRIQIVRLSAVPNDR